MNVRKPLEITLSAWRALFLREALSRLFSARGAWFWLLLEPAFHVTYLLFIFTAIQVRHVGGIETPIWLLAGILGFFLFKRTGAQAANALTANRALFAYRQIKPIDTVMVRAVLEGLVILVVAVLLLAALSLYGYRSIPDNGLLLIFAFLGLWVLGLSFGLIVSVVNELIPEIDRLIGFVMTPLYMLSGVIFPVANTPPSVREWLMLNPLVHGIELAREGFASHYHPIAELSMAYLYAWVLGSLFLGLILHRRFGQRLLTA